MGAHAPAPIHRRSLPADYGGGTSLVGQSMDNHSLVSLLMQNERLFGFRSPPRPLMTCTERFTVHRNLRCWNRPVVHEVRWK